MRDQQIVPISLKHKSFNKERNLSFTAFTLYVMALRRIKHRVIYSHDLDNASRAVGCSPYLFRKYKQELIDNNLIVFDNTNIRIVSPYNHIEDRDAIFSWVDFKECKTVQSYKERLILSISKDNSDCNNWLAVRRSKEPTNKREVKKIKRFARKYKSFEDVREKLGELDNYSFYSNENVNACSSIGNLSRKSLVPRSSIGKVLKKYNSSEYLNYTQVVYRRYCPVELDEYTLNETKPTRFCYAYQRGGMIYYHFGSIFEFNVGTNFFVKDKMQFLNNCNVKAKNKQSSMLKPMPINSMGSDWL